MSVNELIEEGEGESYTNAAYTVDELIDWTIGPHHINNKLLHAILKAFAIKLSDDVKFEFDLDDDTAPVKFDDIDCKERFPNIEIFEEFRNAESREPERILKMPHSALQIKDEDCITLVNLNERVCELEEATSNYCCRMDNLQKNQSALCCETKHINRRICELEPELCATIKKVDCLDKSVYKLRTCCELTNERYKEADTILKSVISEIDDIKRVNFSIQNELEDVMDCYRSVKAQIKELQERTEVVHKIRDIVLDIEKLQHWKRNIKSEFDIMTERYEYLKMVKVNFDDYERELKLKANIEDLKLYTEITHFDSFYKKLKSNLDELTNRFNNSTQCLHNNILNLQAKMKLKTEQCELKRLRQQIESDLIVLNKKFNDLIANRLYSYASAVRTDTLCNVNCLTCTSYASVNEVGEKLPKLPELLGPLGRRRYVGGSHTLLNCTKKKTLKMRGYLKGFSSNRNASCKSTK